MDVETLLTSTELPDVAVDTDRALAATTQRGRQRARRRVAALGTLGIVVVVLVAAAIVVREPQVGERGEVVTGPIVDAPIERGSEGASEGSWTPMAPSPLSARDQGVAAWTGSEVVIVGGSSTTPCGSTTDCAVDLQPLADGAAYDPTTDTWRRIPDAPIPFVSGFATWTGTELLVLADQKSGGSPMLLQFEPDEDRWTTLTSPPGYGFASMTWTGDEWIGISVPNLYEIPPAWRYRPTTGLWEPAASDPGGKAADLRDHQVVWTGTGLVLLGSRYGTDPVNGYWEAAVLDDGAWRWFDRSDIVNNGGTWVAHEGQVLNLLRSSVGGAATGGILDPSSGTWSALPASPAPPAIGGTGYDGSAGPWVVADTRLFDPATGTWRVVEPRPDVPASPEPPAGPSAAWPKLWPAVSVWTGTEIVSWGGRAEPSPTEVTVVATGARYRPPSIGSVPQADAPSGAVPSPGSTPAGSSPRSVPSEPEPGDPATWMIDPGAPPDARATTFTALVTRTGCSGGETGTVLRPGVVFEEDRIVITFTVEAITGDGECPSNPAVPSLADLGQPIGDRLLVDGTCAAERAARTRYCVDDVRWRPDGVAAPTFAVSGQLTWIAPGSAGPQPVAGVVTVLDTDGQQLVEVPTDEAGTFVVDLPTGYYRLVGRSTAVGEGECPSGVIVDDAPVTGVELPCRIP